MSGWALIFLGVLGASWIWALFTKSGREAMQQHRAFETKTTRKRAYGVERLFTPFGSRYWIQTKRVPRKGWWQASDGKWYPPELHPNYRRRPLPPPPPRR
jgi:hypothetical protein